MKAAIYRSYGPPDVVSVEEVAKPTPKPHQILIKIHAATVSSGDWRARSLSVPPGFGLIAPLVFGVRAPRQPILGTELAGEIEAIGANVSKFKVGDAVFAFPSFAMGAHAEYRALEEDGRVAFMPRNLSFRESAALCFGGVTALQFLRDRAKLCSGEKVMVIGASGAVGSAAVQLAKHFGAEVIGVCSGANVDLATSIGADRVIDYAREDFISSDDQYDIICDTIGVTSFAACKHALKPGGRLLLVASGLAHVLAAGSKADGKIVIAGTGNATTEHIRFLKELAEAGAFKPLIDQCFPLHDIVKAHQRVDTGRKTGSVSFSCQATSRNRRVSRTKAQRDERDLGHRPQNRSRRHWRDAHLRPLVAIAENRVWPALPQLCAGRPLAWRLSARTFHPRCRKSAANSQRGSHRLDSALCDWRHVCVSSHRRGWPRLAKRAGFGARIGGWRRYSGCAALHHAASHGHGASFVKGAEPEPRTVPQSTCAYSIRDWALPRSGVAGVARILKRR
jgi:NADPH:quinone reductase-like Zn-dependent oxidoreductase